jgi:hypothetical protein
LKLIINQSARAIYIENAIQSEMLAPEKLLTIKIFGLSTPFTNKPTDSFTVSTFNLKDG